MSKMVNLCGAVYTQQIEAFRALSKIYEYCRRLGQHEFLYKEYVLKLEL